MALERNSLIDRCSTPEVVQEEQNVEIAVDQEGEGGDDDVNDDGDKGD